MVVVQPYSAGILPREERLLAGPEVGVRAVAAAPVIRCDVVTIQKESLFPSLHNPRSTYQAVLRMLLRFVVPQLTDYDELRVVAAEWSPYAGLVDLLDDSLKRPRGRRGPLWIKPYRVMTAPSATHPGLQLADYVAWASHRRRSRHEADWWDALAAEGRACSDHLAF